MHKLRFSLLVALLLILCAPLNAAPAKTPPPAPPPLPPDVLFAIGTPDAKCAEFALVNEGFAAFPKKFSKGISYVIGKSKPERDWPFLHPSKQDESWAKGGPIHPFTIRYHSDKTITEPTTLVLGYMGTQGDLSYIKIRVNETQLPSQLPRDVGFKGIVYEPTHPGKPAANLFTIPAGTLKPGANTITITLEGKSWILYDYIALRKEAKPLDIYTPPPPPPTNLLAEFRKGPDAPMRDVKKIVFAVRADGIDEHWYANFGYYAAEDYYGQNNRGLAQVHDGNTHTLPVSPTTDYSHFTSRGVQYLKNGLSRLVPEVGGKLCLYDLDTRDVRVLLDDPTGAVRDPQVNYDATKILFSYRPGGSEHYHLYEINTDGSALHPLTDGDCDDIEPTYTATGKIIFVSSRANRWVQCWNTPVAILYECDSTGKNIRALSGNVEHDNTPWPLANGQILYTRWEYVDRSQTHFHHLWTMNADGTQQMVYFGNMHPGRVYIDAKPIPGTGKVVSVFSPGHGQVEHAGPVGIIDPRNGPDDKEAARVITRSGGYRDPWAFSEDAFLAARDGNRIVLFDATGREQTLWKLPDEWAARQLRVQEPRPLAPRPRERRSADIADHANPNGRLLLTDVYQGRNMDGIKRGDIKKLLILETLPKPINFTGGMEPITYGGSFTLERVIGTVPVEPDGSAHFELPAKRAFFFVALDENNRSVKRMQSFLSLMPGEVNSCIGCHEERTAAPRRNVLPVAVRRAPSPITPVATPVDEFLKNAAANVNLASATTDVPAAAIPDVLDFSRDVQPVLDRNCVGCHNATKRSGNVNLTGHRSPLYSLSYFAITARGLVADGRNLPKGNYPPRTLGTSASPLYTKYATPAHHGVKLTPREDTVLRLWIETGATYPGTYAALGSGMLGGYAQNRLDRQDTAWPETKALTQVLRENCLSCHKPNSAIRLPESPTHEISAPPWVNFSKNDARRRFARHLLYDLTVPAESALLLGPLAKDSGGYESCGKAIFANKEDPRYKTLLAGIERAKEHLEKIKRFDMPGFVPRPQYIRELKKYGVLPKEHAAEVSVDPYILEQQYWRSLWYKVEK